MVVARSVAKSENAVSRAAIVLSPLPTFLIASALFYLLFSCFELLANYAPLKLAMTAGAGLYLAGASYCKEASPRGNSNQAEGRDCSNKCMTDIHPAMALIMSIVAIEALLFCYGPGEWLPLWVALFVLGCGLLFSTSIVFIDSMRWCARLYRWASKRSPGADVTGGQSG